MIKEVLESWGSKIPPVERFIPYFPLPSPEGVIVISLAKVLTGWNSYLEEQMDVLLKSMEKWGNLEYFKSINMDIIFGQTSQRANIIPKDVAFILNSDVIMDIDEIYDEIYDEGELSSIVREKMGEIFTQCMDILKEEYNAKRESEREDREMAVQHTQV